ncbi:MAG: helix-hairpin-helix domain-containing protein [Ardenticatenales bacterium]|nr:helix-hairpin-helix domain-containing protein [Ardenticatenales bacterium]
MPPSQPPIVVARQFAATAWAKYMSLWNAGRGGIAVALLLPCCLCFFCGSIVTMSGDDAPNPTAPPRPAATARATRTLRPAATARAARTPRPTSEPRATSTKRPATATDEPATETSVPATAVPTELPATVAPAPPTEAPATAHPLGFAAVPPEVPAAPPAAVAQDGCVDINRAGFGDLMRIIHIAEVRANEIIQIRGSRPFRSVDDLTRVNGIGPARLRDIKAEGLACVR